MGLRRSSAGDRKRLKLSFGRYETDSTIEALKIVGRKALYTETVSKHTTSQEAQQSLSSCDFRPRCSDSGVPLRRYDSETFLRVSGHINKGRTIENTIFVGTYLHMQVRELLRMLRRDCHIRDRADEPQ